jgi:hypothetical protein
MYKY